MIAHIHSDNFATFTYETEDERNAHCRSMAKEGWVITSIKGGVGDPLYAAFEK